MPRDVTVVRTHCNYLVSQSALTKYLRTVVIKRRGDDDDKIFQMLAPTPHACPPIIRPWPACARLWCKKKLKITSFMNTA